jgi:hypothetical protein
MPTSREAITRERIQTIVQAVDGVADDDVVLGLKELDVSEEFFHELSAPYVVIEPAEQTGFSMSERLSEFDVECLVYFPLDEGDQTFTEQEDLIFAGIRKAIIEESNWTDAPYPKGIRISKPEVEFLNPIVGLYRIVLSFMGE